MKVLWLTNTILPQIAKEIKLEVNHTCGWLTSLVDDLKDEIELYVLFPVFNKKNIYSGKVENINYISFYQPVNLNSNNEHLLEEKFIEILKKIQVDIIHIWGTEFKRSSIMYSACKKLGCDNNLIVSVQGSSTLIGYHYINGLCKKDIYKKSFKDIIRKTDIINQKKFFDKQGIEEVKLLRNATNIIGRTTWDFAFTRQINPLSKYYHCNENLRDIFYTDQWSYNRCERYTILISQGNYPVKGLHHVLEAIAILKKSYPNIKLNIAGMDVTRNGEGLLGKFKITGYGILIKSLINKLDLSQNVTFLGNLDDKRMMESFLKTNIFVSASSIENESNSLSEAKILGVPCIASYVGGVIDRINHGEDGFFYQHDAPYMLAFYIDKLFKDKELMKKISENSKVNAKRINNREINKDRMMSIYREISNNFSNSLRRS